MSFLMFGVTLVLAGMMLIAIVNALTLSRLKPHAAPARPPKVSILIPARNEVEVIGRTVETLLKQTYPSFELIVLDDHSTDATAAVARAAGHRDPRLRVVPGLPLPAGWLGKNWACHQLAQRATGEWLIFTDADVQWAPEALAALTAEINRTKAAVITVWPTQRTESWPERLVVPMMALAIIGYLPWPLVHHSASPALAAANGQCLAFRRRAYDRVAGHTVVRREVLEDVILARRAKAHGLRLRMVDGSGLISCRMYQNWTGVREGFAKNILAGYGNSPFLLLLAIIFHGLIFLMPWVWLAAGAWGSSVPGWPRWPLALVGLGLGLRGLTAAATRQRLGDAILMPLSVVLMTVIALQSIWWQWRYGGPRWKGRVIKREQVSPQQVPPEQTPARGANG